MWVFFIILTQYENTEKGKHFCSTFLIMLTSKDPPPSFQRFLRSTLRMQILKSHATNNFSVKGRKTVRHRKPFIGVHHSPPLGREKMNRNWYLKIEKCINRVQSPFKLETRFKYIYEKQLCETRTRQYLPALPWTDQMSSSTSPPPRRACAHRIRRNQIAIMSLHSYRLWFDNHIFIIHPIRSDSHQYFNYSIDTENISKTLKTC